VTDKERARSASRRLAIIRHAREVRIFPKLEEQMTTWVPGERSPDRMDALVWAMSRLFYPQKDDEAEIVTADDGMVHISPF